MLADDPLAALAAAAREGDDRALGELVRRTQPAVWALCRSLGSTDDTEDLVQETYLRATGALARYRGDAPVRPWLLSIARRVCADGVRRRTRQRRLLDRLARQASAAGVPIGEPVDDLLAGIDPERREAFVLTQIVGLSYAEAAATLDCPIGTIRSRVARARAELLLTVRRAQAG